jgi:hypothetical protein
MSVELRIVGMLNPTFNLEDCIKSKLYKSSV